MMNRDILLLLLEVGNKKYNVNSVAIYILIVKIQTDPINTQNQGLSDLWSDSIAL